MNEPALRQLLDRALDDEPPLGPIAQNSLRAGTKLRRRRAVGAATVIVTACAAIIPVTIGILGHPPGPAPGHRPAGLAGGPAFFAGVAPTNVVNIYRSTTGRVVASIRPPKPYPHFAAVSRLGSDRTFVAAAVTAFSASGCTSHLFQFSIDRQGHPSGLRPLSVPQVSGQVAELVSSADGKALAFTAPRCATGPAVGMINLATRQTTTWIVPRHGIEPVGFGSLSLTEDGSRLGFVFGALGGVGPTNAYVLPTGSPSGPLMRHATKVLHVPTGVFWVVLSNNGAQAYVETRLGRPFQRGASHVGAVVLSQYSTTTGQRVRRIGQLSPGGKLSPAILFTTFHITMDAAGKHLLAYNPGHRVKAMNLITGHQASTTVSQVPYLDGPYNTAAW